MELTATILVIIGIAQGLFIGSALLLDRTYSTRENKCIGITMYLFSIQGILDLISFWGLGEKYLWLEIATCFGFQGVIFIPYFLSVLKSLKVKFFLPIWTLFIPFLLSVIYGILCFAIIVMDKKDTLWDLFYLDEFWLFHWNLNIIFVLLLDIYLLKLIVKASSTINKRGPFSIWISFSIIITIWIIFNILNNFFASEAYYLFTLTFFWGSVTLFIFWLTYSGVIQQRLINEQKSLHLILRKKKFDKNIPSKNKATNNYYDQFIQLLDEQKIYRNSNLNRDVVAQKLGISAGYFSTVLNEVSSRSFIEVVNEYRVKEVMKILSDGSLNHFSLTAIGLEVGFKSKSSFFANFKKITGLTPSEYKGKNQS